MLLPPLTTVDIIHAHVSCSHTCVGFEASVASGDVWVPVVVLGVSASELEGSGGPPKWHLGWLHDGCTTRGLAVASQEFEAEEAEESTTCLFVLGCMCVCAWLFRHTPFYLRGVICFQS